MHRREFITIFAGAAAMRPLTAGAQQAGRVPRVGYIASSAEEDAQGRQFRRAFRDALEKLGWVDGRNIHTDYRAHPHLEIGAFRCYSYPRTPHRLRHS
jgi:putative ABC transport system substrate-binding protein